MKVEILGNGIHFLPRMTTKYVTVKLPKDLADLIDEMLESKYAKMLGYTSRVDIIREGIKRLHDEFTHRALVHLNTFEDHLEILDFTGGLHRIARVFLKKTDKGVRLYCDVCEAFRCLHVEFARSLEDVRKLKVTFFEEEG